MNMIRMQCLMKARQIQLYAIKAIIQSYKSEFRQKGENVNEEAILLIKEILRSRNSARRATTKDDGSEVDCSVQGLSSTSDP
jgi:hypothetical protein